MKRVAFVVSQYLEGNRLFDISSSRDRILERFVLLKELLNKNGISCDTYDLCDYSRIDVLVCSDISLETFQVLKAIKSNPDLKLLYLPTEPPVVKCMHEEGILAKIPFDAILYWNDELVSKYSHVKKCNIGQPVIHPEEIPYVDFVERKFLSAITSSKLIRHKRSLHGERFKAFELFSSKDEGLDLYGVGWDACTLPFVSRSYRGVCESKKEVMKNYKFSICFENAKGYPGLITEKIFDCLSAGSVPVYMGPPNVREYIPGSCYVDVNDFESYEQLYHYLVKMKVEQYQVYLDAAKKFLKSEAYEQFTSTGFAKTVSQQIQELVSDSKDNTKSVTAFKRALFFVLLQNLDIMLKNIRQTRHFILSLLRSY